VQETELFGLPQRGYHRATNEAPPQTDEVYQLARVV